MFLKITLTKKNLNSNIVLKGVIQMKRILGLIIACCLIYNYSFASIIEDSADTLNKMKILNGYEDGSLGLEKNITRAEFCALIINMFGINDFENLTNRFSDIKDGAWYYNAINKVAELGYINGYKEDGTFRPSNNITYAESCAIMVNILGYNSELEGVWPNNVINKANELGITNGLESEIEASYKMTRGEISVMIVNSMNTKVKVYE